MIVSKDTDFRERSYVEGFPPKTIWLDVGNAETVAIAELLRRECGRVDWLHALVNCRRHRGLYNALDRGNRLMALALTVETSFGGNEMQLACVADYLNAISPCVEKQPNWPVLGTPTFACIASELRFGKPSGLASSAAPAGSYFFGGRAVSVRDPVICP